MADGEQPPAKRSRFDSSNGQAASNAAAPGAAPVKQVNLATAQAAMERAKAALERKKALDAKLKASKVTCYTLQPDLLYVASNMLCIQIMPAGNTLMKVIGTGKLPPHDFLAMCRSCQHQGLLLLFLRVLVQCRSPEQEGQPL